MMRVSMFHARLARIEPAMNKARALCHAAFAPKRSIAHPAMGTAMPSASK